MERKPLVIVNGVVGELSNSDSLAVALSDEQVTTALGFVPEDSSKKDQPNGYAGLDASGKLNETLVWTTSGSYRTLTGYKENSTVKTVRTAEFFANKLRLTLATFTPTIAATSQPGATLNWDVPATGFSVSVDNPSDVTDQYVSSVSAVTGTSGSVSALAAFTAGAKSATPAGGVDWAQSFTGGYIRPTSSTIVGGSASAEVAFRYYDGSGELTYATTANFAITWATPTISNTVGSLTGLTFLQTYTSVAYTINVTGVANASSYSNSVTAVGGTVSNSSGSGTLTFATPIHKDNTGTVRTTSVTTTFTRPSAVTGSSYTAQLSATTPSPTAAFTYPSLWVFTASASAVPTRATFVTGTGFQSGVTVLGNLASSFAGFVQNSTSNAQVFWLAVKSGGAQPTTFKTGASSSLLSDVTPITGNTVNLQPDTPPSGYNAVAYSLYGITLQPGNTYVSIA